MGTKVIFIEMSAYVTVQAYRAVCCLAFDVSYKAVSGQTDRKEICLWMRVEGNWTPQSKCEPTETASCLLFLTSANLSVTVAQRGMPISFHLLFMLQTKGDLWFLGVMKTWS